MIILFTFIGFFFAGWTFKEGKWTQGTFILCFTFAIHFGGTIQIPEVSGSINNSFNLSRRVEGLEKEIKNLKLDSAEIKRLVVTEGPLEIRSENKGQSSITAGLVVNSERNSASIGDFQVRTAPVEHSIYIKAATGNVGVGTNSPATTLDVAGVISIKETKTGNGQGTPLCIDKNHKICNCGACE